VSRRRIEPQSLTNPDVTLLGKWPPLAERFLGVCFLVVSFSYLSVARNKKTVHYPEILWDPSNYDIYQPH
jgi:hypothetical protein